MRLKDLNPSKAKMIGTGLLGYAKLSRLSVFPELLLRQVRTVEEAAHFGGILVETSTGYHVFACQDPDALLQTELVNMAPGSLDTSPGAVYARTTTGVLTGVNFHLRERPVTGSNYADRAYGDAQVVAWCAIATPCNGFGFHPKSGSAVTLVVPLEPNSYAVEFGSADASGAITGTVHKPTYVGHDAALVLWRHCALATRASLFFTEEMTTALLETYPVSLRGAAGPKLRTELNRYANTAVGVDFFYVRKQVDAASSCRTIGFLHENKCRVGSTIADGRALLGRVIIPSVSTTAQGNPLKAPAVDDVAVELGNWAFDSSGNRARVPFIGNQVIYGVDIDKAGVIPQTIVFNRVGIDVAGMLGDFFAGNVPPAVGDKVTGDAVAASELLDQVLARGRSTDYSAGAGAVDYVVTREPLFNNDVLSIIVNALARVDAELTGARVKHLSGTRVYAASKADGAIGVRRYALYGRGALWSGASKNGIRAEFSTVGAQSFSVSHTRVKYGARWFNVYEVFVAGKRVLHEADPEAGSDIQDATTTARGVFVSGGTRYGDAATASTAPVQGCLVSIVNGTEALLASLGDPKTVA